MEAYRPPSSSGEVYLNAGDRLEGDILECLRRNAPDEALLLAERLPDSPARLYLEGIAFFRLSVQESAENERLLEAARRFHQLAAQTTSEQPHPLSSLQQELVTEAEERIFLSLLTQLTLLAPGDSRLIELQAESYLQLGQVETAEKLLRHALAWSPENSGLRNALATVLSERGTFDEVLSLLRGLCTTSPDRWAPYSNLGCVLTNLGRTEEALSVFRQAIALAPQEPRVRLNHSLALLKGGRFTQGWQEHEWRLKLPGHTSLPHAELLPTLGADNDVLRGKRVLVTQEEGLGDTLMYLRYLPLLAGRGAHLHVWCSPELSSLLENMPSVHTVQVGGETPDYDYHCPFISLPRVFSAVSEDPAKLEPPYLTVSAERRRKWQARLEKFLENSPQKNPPPALRVGLVWAGGRHDRDRNARLLDRHRSMPLATLAPLASLPDIQFFNLQKGPDAAQKRDFPFPMIDLMEECADMEDTAALMEQLDLVISVDTSAAHLAGALGKDVILLDRFCSCWRWGHDETRSHWYPTLRIVRQTHFDDWESVIARVKELLADWPRA